MSADLRWSGAVGPCDGGGSGGGTAAAVAPAASNSDAEHA
eukprot:CAMPEP_0202359864 /NCGR_PEP_ID=MMETSP1126-20121109/13011_1 /ASSEMBLY_ACC=CAM_ASM_000457 /TAXON_ID=3047 /ORGANISM="Dunaliella tertiolecta, Strain CCMP1320" /LENGTH=39 /DNA_ID= /DNA_START= /DNA_END= /DNA_ORIENTATION=